MSGLKLRPYQVEALDAIEAAWAGAPRGTGTGVVNRPACVMATGMGKTVIFANLPKRARAAQRPGRTLVLVHRDELAQQAARKVHSVDPGLSIGRVQGAQNETDAQVIIGSVPTLANLGRRAQITDVGQIIADECHHAVAPTWMRTLEHFGAFNGCPTVGFTATLARGDDLGLGDVWQEVVTRKGVIDGIKGGYLVDVRGKRVQVSGLDLDKVKRAHGDMQAGDLGQALEDADAAEQVAAAYIEHAKDRQGVVFAPTVQTAYEFADAFNAAGISCEVIDGETPIEVRQATYERFRTGATQVLANCMVLTEGWDAPWASCAVIARPTSSAPLYVQMVGRVLRPWRGKHDALVLDVVGTTAKHRLATLADLSLTLERPPEQDKTLLEAETEALDAELAALLGEPAPAAVRKPVGNLVSTDVDLFSESASAWLQTRCGVWFIPTGKALFFLWPEPGGTFTIGESRAQPPRTRAKRHASGMTLEYGMRHAETLAMERDSSISSKAASWRRKQPPSAAQVRMAAELGIPVDESTTKAQLSDAITVHFASMILDPR